MQIEKTADALFEAVRAYLEKRLKNLPVPLNGKDGIDGTPGQKGIDGTPGADGKPGIDGAQGMQGEKGMDGAPGEHGEPGPAGERGEKGDTGERGEKGEPGIDGKDGAPGRDGIDGKSVSLEDVDAMVQRCVQDAVQKAVAAIVVKDGVNGLDGRDGQKGEPGRDAAQLDILPSINEERSYGRGTFANHKGGLWRATRTTDGMDGWECIVDGVAEIKVSFIGRSGFVSVEKSSGTPDLHPFSLPAMLYRGVFREGDEYQQGDTVTWGGSLWFCNEATKDKPLDGSKSWQLCAKKGRDGKDGRNGIDAMKPVKLA